jgi:hypothetical protein
VGTLDEERARIMILRAWVEAGAHQRLRVRVTQVTHEHSGEPMFSAAATIDDVCALVRAWLEELLDDRDCPSDPSMSGSRDPQE